MNKLVAAQMSTAALEQEIAELVKPRTMTEVVENLNKEDVSYQTGEYTALVDLEAQNIADQLRQRAHMMRLRADEFDVIADGMIKASYSLVKESRGFQDSHASAMELLRAHAHIKPTKVTGG